MILKKVYTAAKLIAIVALLTACPGRGDLKPNQLAKNLWEDLGPSCSLFNVDGGDLQEAMALSARMQNITDETRALCNRSLDAIQGTRDRYHVESLLYYQDEMDELESYLTEQSPQVYIYPDNIYELENQDEIDRTLSREEKRFLDNKRRELLVNFDDVVLKYKSAIEFCGHGNPKLLAQIARSGVTIATAATGANATTLLGIDLITNLAKGLSDSFRAMIKRSGKNSIDTGIDGPAIRCAVESVVGAYCETTEAVRSLKAKAGGATAVTLSQTSEAELQALAKAGSDNGKKTRAVEKINFIPEISSAREAKIRYPEVSKNVLYLLDAHAKKYPAEAANIQAQKQNWVNFLSALQTLDDRSKDVFNIFKVQATEKGLYAAVKRATDTYLGQQDNIFFKGLQNFVLKNELSPFLMFSRSNTTGELASIEPHRLSGASPEQKKAIYRLMKITSDYYGDTQNSQYFSEQEANLRTSIAGSLNHAEGLKLKAVDAARVINFENIAMLEDLIFVRDPKYLPNTVRYYRKLGNRRADMKGSGQRSARELCHASLAFNFPKKVRRNMVQDDVCGSEVFFDGGAEKKYSSILSEENIQLAFQGQSKDGLDIVCEDLKRTKIRGIRAQVGLTGRPQIDMTSGYSTGSSANGNTAVYSGSTQNQNPGVQRPQQNYRQPNRPMTN